jgi:uncharacterized protein (TIGR03435 family)
MMSSFAVTAQQSPTSFEVASVKPVKREVPLQRPQTCSFPSRERFTGFGTLRFFIACAYRIAPGRAEQEMSGGPSWIDEALFEIAATTSPDHPLVSVRDGLTMLQALLGERFKLAVHREAKEVPTYALVIAKRDHTLGPRLRPTRDDCRAWIDSGRRGAPPATAGDLACGRQSVSGFAIRSSAIPLSQFTTLLSARVGRPIEDRTDLTGLFALDLQWKSESGSSDTPVSDELPTSIFTALEEQLGLKLESTRALVDVLVIDHVERPTEN